MANRWVFVVLLVLHGTCAILGDGPTPYSGKDLSSLVKLLKSLGNVDLPHSRKPSASLKTGRNRAMEFGPPTSVDTGMFPVGYGPLPFQPTGFRPSPVMENEPRPTLQALEPPQPVPSPQYRPPTRVRSDVSVKQHLLEAIHHIVSAVSLAPEELLRQITTSRPEVAPKIRAIEELLKRLPTDRLMLLRSNPDVVAIMRQLGVRLPADVVVVVPSKPEHVDAAIPKPSVELKPPPIPSDESTENQYEVPKEHGELPLAEDTPKPVVENQYEVPKEHGTLPLAEQVTTRKPEPPVDYAKIIEDEIAKGLQPPRKNSSTAGQVTPEKPAVEAPHKPEPATPPKPVAVEVTTEFSESVEVTYLPEVDIPQVEPQPNPWSDDSFKQTLLQGVTNALRAFQARYDLTTRPPPPPPMSKTKEEQLQDLLQDTRNKIADMLKIIDKAADDGSIPDNVADELDLNTPNILLQLTQLEELLKDGNTVEEPKKPLPTMADGTLDWSKLLHGRDPPTGGRVPQPDDGKE